MAGVKEKMKLILPGPVQRAIDQLRQAGYAAYAVGGCVRDHVLGRTPHDYDICTAAVPEKMQEIFRRERTVETGIRHGTLTVILENMPLEITTFRQDGRYLDGRHPESVLFTPNIKEDLARRDFTINAMAYAPDTGLIDPFSGQQDCRDGIIRCVGEAEKRFEEDALRILRALRFAARLGFAIEESTAQAIHALRHTLSRVSRERIAAEWTGLLKGRFAAQVLEEYGDVLLACIPDFSGLMGEPARYHAALSALMHLPEEEMLRWAALLWNIADRPEESAAEALSIMKGLKMSLRMQEGVSHLVLWARTESTPGSMQEMLMHLGPEALAQLMLLQKARGLAESPEREAEILREYAEKRRAYERLLAENACYSLAQLHLSGRDLAALGLRGAEIGKMLQGLLLQVVRGEVKNERKALLERASARRKEEKA